MRLETFFEKFELFADTPDAVAKMRELVLQLAVQGCLVSQSPNGETADTLAATVAEDRAIFVKKRSLARRRVFPPVEEDECRFAVPSGWVWTRLGNLCRVQAGFAFQSVGVAEVYRGEPDCFVYPDLMMKLRVSAAFDVGYVHLAMSHDAPRDFLSVRASGTSGSMPKINQTTLKSLPLPIPPLAEQRRIVAKVEQLMALVDSLETQLAASRATAAKLLEALVAELTVC